MHDDVLKSDCVDGIKSAFMEYSEPSIATQLKAFDVQGYTDIIVVPLTGLFVLRGRKGITGRGAIFAAAGILVALIYLFSV